jgi:hypothetical protein
MADYTLKNIPESLRSRLQAEADRSFRSINQEILYRLERSFNSDDAKMAATHARWVYEALNSGPARPLTEAKVKAAFNRGVKRAKARKSAAA